MNREIKVCLKCGVTYSDYPALSRIDNSEICSDCGVKEALDAAKISQENQKDILNCVHSINESKRIK